MGINLVHVDQTSPYIITRIAENQKKNSLVGQNFFQCFGSMHDVEMDKPNACCRIEKRNETRSDLHQKIKTGPQNA